MLELLSRTLPLCRSSEGQRLDNLRGGRKQYLVPHDQRLPYDLGQLSIQKPVLILISSGEFPATDHEITRNKGKSSNPREKIAHASFVTV